MPYNEPNAIPFTRFGRDNPKAASTTARNNKPARAARSADAPPLLLRARVVSRVVRAEVGGAETLLDAARDWLIEKPVEAMQPGDVLLFRMAEGVPVKHCAVLSAVGGSEPRMIHAYWGRAVVESWMGPWWRRRLTAVFAFPAERAE